MTTEELKVVLRRSENSGFGFSLLGTTGPPHVIYDIVENSPAADCGAVEAGDVILKVNGTDVHRYTTKEVLKCLRLSDDLVTLELKRDPKLKAHIKEQLANAKGPHYIDIETQNNYDYHSSITGSSSAYYAEAAKYASLSSNSNEQTNSSNVMANSPASRCRTTAISNSHISGGGTTQTNMSPRHQIVTSSNNHSRSSSASSVKIQLSENNATNYVGNVTSQNATSPTSRPSRIPQAVKCPQKISPGHNSPHQKRSRVSHIPTKAGTIGNVTTTPITANSNGDTTTITTAATIMTTATTHVLQHSNSYSGTNMNDGSRNSRYRSQCSEEKDNEPISAPPQPMKTPRFEAYMMTGDLILNLSRTPQNSNVLLAQAKKVDSLRDSIIKPTRTIRPNGALAPKASGESSPTSSSSLESPNHTASLVSSSHNVLNKDKNHLFKGIKEQHGQSQSQAHDSFNNSFNNRKDSLTNDTLQLCEELERDDNKADIYGQSPIQCQRHHINKQIAQQQQQRSRQQQQFVQNKQNSFEQYDQNDAGIIDDDDYNYDRQSPPLEYENENDEEENEEDQTNYDITNLETYNSGGGAGADDEASDRQYLLQYDGKNDEEDSVSTKHLNALKQRAALRYKERINQDTVDCTRNVHNSGSTSSSATVGCIGGSGGTNTSQDETSFSVPTSPISLSTPLIDKETANSMPTSPEPSNIIGGSVTVDCNASGVVVVRRHNGIVRTCDSAGFRTSKSEDHLQQIQREGMAAVIPIDIDEDVNSSLNTLLDTRQDSEDSQASNRDRIVWTYNAPLQPHQLAALQQQQQQQQQQNQHQCSNSSHHVHHIPTNSSYHNSHSSSISSSPHNSVGSPASPTSVSSSVMSSSGSKSAQGVTATNYSHSSEAIQQPQHQYEKQQQQQHQQQHLTQGQQQLIVSNGGINKSTNRVGTIAMNLNLLQCPNGNNSVIGGGYNSFNTNTNSVGVGMGSGGGGGGGGGDHSVSEAVSNISSPDYQDDDNLLSSRDLLGGMVLSDPSDSDSTILISETALQRQHQHRQKQQKASEHKVVIQVRGADSLNTNNINNNNNNNNKNNQGSSPKSLYAELKDSENELAAHITEVNTTCNTMGNNNNNNAILTHGDSHDSSPSISDDGSDVESLHSYHYSPKAVDMPSAIRLAKRLYSLDGFKKSDVSRHLSKNNDFSRAVADEYLKYFNFEQKTLDQSLREFLQQFSLSGETQERERVLVHFSKRYLDCNPGSFNSQDAVHTLTCAIMLLNTDLHGQNIGRKMTCAEFIENLAELNDGDNFPKEVLKYLYQAIKTQPLEWALDDDTVELQKQLTENKQALTGSSSSHIGQNPFLDLPESSTAVEYKKGYVMRKCCYDANYKKTPFGKRSWKMFYCTLRDLVLYLHKDEHGFRKSQMSDNLHNAIRIHHALATKAADYIKKQHVFRLQTADQAEYLFQTSDSKELQSWVETINFVCAAYSAPSLEAGVGSQKRFQRPLLPSTHTKLLMKDQLEAHEKLVTQFENSLIEHRKGGIPNKGLALQNYKEKESYLQYELRRYKAYVSILSAKILADQQQLEIQEQQQQQQQQPLQQTQTDQLLEECDKFPKRFTSPTVLTTNTNNIINASHQTQQLSSPSSVIQAQSGNRKTEKKK